MKTILAVAAILITLLAPSFAWAQYYDCSSGVCRWVPAQRSAMIAPVYSQTTARIDALSAKIDRLAVAMQRFGTISESEYQTFAAEPVMPVQTASPYRFANYQVQAVQAAPVTAGTTCDCAVTGVCTCNPATCMCAACANGSVRMGLSSPYYTSYSSGYYGASYGVTAMSGLTLPAVHTPRQHRIFDRLNRRAARNGLQ